MNANPVKFSPEKLRHHIESLATHLDGRMKTLKRESFCLVGIHSGGAWIAEALQSHLKPRPPLGTIDVSFYRDDFQQRGLNSKVKPSSLPFEVDNKHLVLVDDVLMSGRTIRAAMNELFDYGRPASVSLVVLFDVGRRELPISADLCAETLALDPQQRVELRGPSPLTAEIIQT